MTASQFKSFRRVLLALTLGSNVGVTALAAQESTDPKPVEIEAGSAAEASAKTANPAIPVVDEAIATAARDAGFEEVIEVTSEVWKATSPGRRDTADVGIDLASIVNVYDKFTPCREAPDRPSKLTDLDGGYEVFYYSFSEDNAAKLGLIAAGAIGGAKRSVVQVYRFMQVATRTCRIGGMNRPVTWAAGAEAVLHVKTAKRGVNLDKLSTLAAAVEFNRASVAFSMNTPGITGTPIRKALPDAGAFNVENYAKMVSAVDQVRLLMDSGGVTVKPQMLIELDAE